MTAGTGFGGRTVLVDVPVVVDCETAFGIAVDWESSVAVGVEVESFGEKFLQVDPLYHR